MKTTIHRSNDRGYADHGWLKSHHSFSFAGFYHPERIHFGMLRVLNDDVVAGGKGFGSHPHDNMEIISIPLKGRLAHKDSMGSEEVIGAHDVQVMSAGTGMLHSEYNESAHEEVHFLQIWIFPATRGIAPRHDQRRYDPKARINTFQKLVTPFSDSSEALKINQDAYIARATLQEGQEIVYELNKSDNGLYLFVIDGHISIGGETLEKRDAIGIESVQSIELSAIRAADVLAIEVPMN